MRPPLAFSSEATNSTLFSKDAGVRAICAMQRDSILVLFRRYLKKRAISSTLVVSID
jgi:hypothetical protein